MLETRLVQVIDRYKHISTVYDTFFTGYDWCIEFIHKTIQEYTKSARSLLEVGCGTGNVLQQFVDKYEIAGLDISPSQLEQAKKKLPEVPFYALNMANFNLNRTFDIVLSNFDVINHLLEYADWIKTFECVRNHLNPGGVFIFDMNTVEGLNSKSRLPAIMHQKDDTYMSMKITKIDENVWNFNVKIFKKVRDNLYELDEDNIGEASFSPQKVKQDLETLFGKVRIHTYDDGPNIVKGRTFFVCQV